MNLSEGGPLSSKTYNITVIPMIQQISVLGLIYFKINGKKCVIIMCTLSLEALAHQFLNKSAWSKTREKEKQSIKHQQMLQRTTNCTSERLPPTISRWASESGKWPILSPPTPSVQLQFLYRSLITIMSQSPAFNRLLTCTVLTKQQSSSLLSSPTAKTH